MIEPHSHPWFSSLEIQPQQLEKVRCAILTPATISNQDIPGWGNGFLTTLKSPAKAVNYGHSGATIPTFKSGGDWAKVLADVKKYKSSHSVMVTIQFGHNDQKVAAAKTGYSANLKGLVDDVTAAGGIPVS